ncbi:hypothetical protein SARC_14076, partial [Sphaeroforma arctica JP610]
KAGQGIEDHARAQHPHASSQEEKRQPQEEVHHRRRASGQPHAATRVCAQIRTAAATRTCAQTRTAAAENERGPRPTGR